MHTFTATFDDTALTVTFTADGIRGDTIGQRPFYEPDPSTYRIEWPITLGGEEMHEADLSSKARRALLNLADILEFQPA